MTGFVARYGRVRYADYLGDRYPREGACELGVCLSRRAEDMRHAARRLEDIPSELAALDARLSAPIADPLLRRATMRHRDRLARQLQAGLPDPPASRASMLVFDHCHIHGWVRGLVCMACNNALRDVEHGWRDDRGSAEFAAMLAHLAKCPGCVARYAIRYTLA